MPFWGVQGGSGGSGSGGTTTKNLILNYPPLQPAARVGGSGEATFFRDRASGTTQFVKTNGVEFTWNVATNAFNENDIYTDDADSTRRFRAVLRQESGDSISTSLLVQTAGATSPASTGTLTRVRGSGAASLTWTSRTLQTPLVDFTLPSDAVRIITTADGDGTFQRLNNDDWRPLSDGVTVSIRAKVLQESAGTISLFAERVTGGVTPIGDGDTTTAVGTVETLSEEGITVDTADEWRWVVESSGANTIYIWEPQLTPGSSIGSYNPIEMRWREANIQNFGRMLFLFDVSGLNVTLGTTVDVAGFVHPLALAMKGYINYSNNGAGCTIDFWNGSDEAPYLNQRSRIRYNTIGTQLATPFDCLVFNTDQQVRYGVTASGGSGSVGGYMNAEYIPVEASG